jgi:hypothetical protein
VHWQHPQKVTREKRKRKETNKKKLQQAIESQTKAKSKITWRRQVSDPLGKGNGSTHPRQNYAQAKSASHQTKLEKPQRAPSEHMQAPPEPMQLPLHANHLKKTSAQLSPVRPVTTTGQTGPQHMNRASTLTGQTGALDRSDRCATEPRKGSKPLENLLNAPSKPFQAQTSPPCWKCMNQAKNAKMQPRASQIDKIQQRLLHMSKWAS